MSMKIRLAEEKDCESILNIYAPFITDSVITFECQVPTPKEFGERMAHIQGKFPWLVCESNNDIVGYAYASAFREREAYQWSADLSVYVSPMHHRKNIGRALYYALIEILKLLGYYNVYAGVTVPNIKSESLHEAVGFQTVGIYHNTGYKLNRWHDVKWYELKIAEHNPSPAKPKAITEISTAFYFKEIFEKAEHMIKAD